MSKKYAYYGSAGKTFQDKKVKEKFGAKSTRAGSRGERLLFKKLRGPKKDRSLGWLPADVPLFCSLKVPGKASDIDFAICRGDTILLIDAKMYGQSGGIYWSKGNDPHIYYNAGKYIASNGDEVKMSKSMIMAKDILSRSHTVKKHGLKVEAAVFFVSDTSKKNTKLPFVWFLRFPGGIKTYNERGAYFFLKRFLLFKRRTDQTKVAEEYLRSLCQ